MKQYRTAAALIVLTAAALALRTPRGALAQRLGNGSLAVRVDVADDSFKALQGRGVMVSVIRDGEVTAQQECHLNSSVRFELAPGLYDVRVEGDGMVTMVKRGIHVFEGKSTETLAGPMRAGTGAHVVEYAVGGLSREEVAARLTKLEAAVAALQKGR
jgi:hypothetical protein